MASMLKAPMMMLMLLMYQGLRRKQAAASQLPPTSLALGGRGHVPRHTSKRTLEALGAQEEKGGSNKQKKQQQQIVLSTALQLPPLAILARRSCGVCTLELCTGRLRMPLPLLTTFPAIACRNCRSMRAVMVATMSMNTS